MSITTISTENCEVHRAGIRCIWAIPCQAITDLTIDFDAYAVTAISINCNISEFVKIEFEQGTAYLQQDKVIVSDSATSIVQSIEFSLEGLSVEYQNALRDLNENPCLHVIVLDAAGNYHYCGISYFADSDEWVSEEMRTGDGSSVTQDAAQYTETLVASTNMYALTTSSPELIACEPCGENALLSANDDCLIDINDEELLQASA